APSRFLEKEDGSKLDKGQTAEFVVLEFSKEYRRVVVSHTSIFKVQERKNIKVAAKKSADAEKTTLGDIGGLAALKKKMEEGK
ncbi:MAG: 30S ribosomal protein S1, partial [Polaribacter sp.]|nr:30S ribosomal protein S1 [Polaribacter sp.]MDG1321380.1 30S ribosomal protein S1 [Polaribacter sp.]